MAEAKIMVETESGRPMWIRESELKAFQDGQQKLKKGIRHPKEQELLQRIRQRFQDSQK